MSASAQLGLTITAAHNLLVSGTLNNNQFNALNAALTTASTFQGQLQALINETKKALAELKAALSSGTEAEIAAKLTAAELAAANLSAKASAEIAANAELHAAIVANTPTPGAAQPPQTQTPPTETTTATTTVIPAGPITWAPGFGPNGVVASVQTAPTAGSTTTTSNNTAVAGVQTVPQTGAQSGSAVAGVQNLPSTNTGDTSGLLGLGAALMALGAFLVRMPTKSRK
jgi:hypothetical protein